MQNTGHGSDLLYTFTGLSGARIAEFLRTSLNKREDLQAALAERLTSYPMESVFGFLLTSSAAFYLVERSVNPKISTFVDALYYISTCMSVGYADIFAQTQTGKAIASLVMAVGPALTSELLDPPHRAAAASAVGQEQIIARLDAILDELQRPARSGLGDVGARPALPGG